MTGDSPQQSPSLLRRLAAMLYDGLLVIALVAVVNALALGILVGASGGERELLPPVVVQMLTVATVVGFYTMFWLKSGQTLGMQAWRVKLQGIDGRPLTLARALLRCVGAFLSAACLGCGYLWCLVDRHGRYWHDHLSGSELVLLPKADGSSQQPG